MNTEYIKSKILEAAIQGKLVPQDSNEEPASAYLERIELKRQELINQKVIKPKENIAKPIKEDDIPFELPIGWSWCRIAQYTQKVTDFVASGSFASLRANVKYYKTENHAILVRTKDFTSNFSKELVYTDKHGYDFLENSRLFGGELVLPNVGSVGKVFIVPDLGRPMTLAPNAIMIRFFFDEQRDWLYYFFSSRYGNTLLNDISKATAQGKFNKTDFKQLIVPIPPIEEQKRIVSALKEGFDAIDAIAEAKENLSSTAEMLRSKILQAAFDGSLTGADFTKSLVQLGNVCDIARGGSPRPIKQYITTAANGVNWIKIGDTDKGGKYINSCKEKIKPEGVKRSREVHKGDFLLTNSMSFGRPYITNIDGCIHDGWLVISPHDNTFDKDFLFYLLSSSYVYAQFCDKATGSTVSNLNIDRVKATSVPMPSIAEQKRIVAKIEELFAEIDKLTK